MNAGQAILAFVEFLAPLVPEIRKLACQFWQCKVADLGPMPPDMKRWEELDRAIDAKRAARRAKK